MTPSLYSLLFSSLSFSHASVRHFLPQGVWDTRWTPDFYCYGACCSMPPSLCLSVTILRSYCRDHMKPGLPNFCLTDVLNLDLQLCLSSMWGLAHEFSQSPALGHLLSWLFWLGIFGGIVCWYLFWQLWVWQRPTVVLLTSQSSLLLSLCVCKSWIDTPTLCLALLRTLTAASTHSSRHLSEIFLLCLDRPPRAHLVPLSLLSGEEHEKCV